MVSKKLKHEYPMGLDKALKKWRESKCLRNVYYYWYDKIIKELQIKEGDSILEIGCGLGNFAVYLKNKFKKSINYTGIDYISEPIGVCKERRLGKNFTFLHKDATKLSLKKKFNKIVGIDVFHHLDYQVVFNKIHKNLKKGGRFSFIEPSSTFCGKYIINFFHHENTLKYPTTIQLKIAAKRAHLNITKIKHFGVILHPLSGGFSRKEIIKHNYRLIFTIDKLLSKIKPLCLQQQLVGTIISYKSK